MPSLVRTGLPDQESTANERLAIFLDSKRAPIIHVSIRGEVSDIAFGKYLADSNRVIAADQRYVLLYNMLGYSTLSPRQRQLQAEWVKDNKCPLQRLCLGVAFVVDSAVTRGMLTAFFWMTQLPFEFTVVGQLHQGIEWVEERLTKAGIALP